MIRVLCLSAVAVMCLTSFAGLPPARHPALPAAKFERQFVRTAVEDVSGKRLSVGPFLVTGGGADAYNSMTAGWGSYGVLWSKPIANVYIRTERFTNVFMKDAPLFTISYFPGKENTTVVNVFGKKSGRDADKIKLSGYTPLTTPEGGVTYAEASLVLVCRKLMAIPLDKRFVPPDILPTVSDRSHHIQYTGEVIGVWKKR